MAGLIRREDVEAVRDRTRIEDVVGDHVTLKPAGLGSLKGLCPFHDERTPSFNVRPAVGRYHCFGCGEGGDVYDFLIAMDHLSFTEAVERLAGRIGYTLRYEDGSATDRAEYGRRQRLLDANAAAESWFREQLMTPGAQVGRVFLAERGFDQGAAEHFGVGFAPASWDALIGHLRGRGFRDQEILDAGLITQGEGRGPYDRFRGRLVWPIRDITGATIGFGARRLMEQDKGPKYLNTPQTRLYNKSQVLYGLDLSKRDIARSREVVVVEGYTDVMAMHLAGITRAIASCGTAFGAEHIKVLRRLLVDDDSRAGQIIFTFDGDAAGRNAAMKAFEDEQRFVAQTFVAVQADGLDPCDLRLARGDQALRDLVDHRQPLFEFVIRTTLATFDLEHAEGRVGALRAVAPVVAGIKDPSLRPEYARQLSGWLGMNPDDVLRAVRAAENRAAHQASQQAGHRPGQPGNQRAGQLGNQRPGHPQQPGNATHGDPTHGTPSGPSVIGEVHDPVIKAERWLLGLVLQQPEAAQAAGADQLGSSAFREPAHQLLWEAIRSAWMQHSGAQGASSWMGEVSANVPQDLRGLVDALAVRDLPLRVGESPAALAERLVMDARQRDLLHREEELRGRAQRMEAAGDSAGAAKVFGELVALTTQRKALGG